MTEDSLGPGYAGVVPVAGSGTFLSQKALAARWNKSERTLEAWRQRGIGPAYVKIGHSVRYRLGVIEAYEEANLHHGGRDRPR